MSIDEIIGRSTEPLRDDPGLHDETAAELRSHLAATVSALEAGGRTLAEAETLAAECFGDPEAIGDRLLEVNFARMKFRARMRLALKLLALPLLLLALVCAIDLKMLAGVIGMNPAAPLWVHSLTDTSPVNAEFDLLGSKPDSKEAREIYERNIHNPVYRMAWLQSMCWLKPEKRELIGPELRRARELEPGNACYSYLLAELELKDAVVVKAGGKNRLSAITEIKDRERFERGMAEVRRGLEQPYFNTYTREAMLERLGPAPKRRNFPNALRDVGIVAGTVLPWLPFCRTQGELIPLYGKLLAEEGRLAEADFFLNGYKKWAYQLNENALFLIDEFTIFGSLGNAGNTLAECYREQNRPDLAKRAKEQTDRAYSVYAAFRAEHGKRKSDLATLKARGGVFGGLWNGTFDHVAREDLRPELKLSYNLLDNFLLAGLECILAFLGFFSFVMWILFHKEGSFLVLLPAKEYAKLILWGILLPVAGYFLLTRIDWISGRDYSFKHNGIRIGVQVGFFLILMPAWAAVLSCCKVRKHFSRSGQKPKSNLVFGNVLLLLVFFLLGTAVFSRVILEVEQRCYFKQENFVFPSRREVGFTMQETRLVTRWRNENRAIFEELLREPQIRLKP